jgi:probable F420-dependent oxidoreductase
VEGTSTMKFGISIFFTDYSIHPADLAVAAEERGFESLWAPEHSHIPVTPLTPSRDQPGLPAMYYDVVDPFVALSMAAQATRALLLGTSICLVVQRDPIQLAKQVASLDVLSKGRFLLGVGSGWLAPEMADHGTRYEERHRIMRERIEAMKVMWTRDTAEYHGKYVDFGPMYSFPKPCQKPYPPILLAAEPSPTFKRVLDYADGWFPVVDENNTAALEHVPRFRELARAAGRASRAMEVSVLVMCAPDEGLVRRIADAGVDRVVLLMEPAGRDKALEILDNYTVLMKRFRTSAGDVR